MDPHEGNLHIVPNRPAPPSTEWSYIVSFAEVGRHAQPGPLKTVTITGDATLQNFLEHIGISATHAGAHIQRVKSGSASIPTVIMTDDQIKKAGLR